jgi:hypothetical protein
MAISDNSYNAARSTLALAGSQTAAKSHPKHNTSGGSPDSQGQELLREARDEFRKDDAKHPNLKSGMTQAHYDAIHKAAEEMGIANW